MDTDNNRHDSADQENFPTSARPIFRALSLLVLVIVLMCALLYFEAYKNRLAEDEQLLPSVKNPFEDEMLESSFAPIAE